jgi:transglutaminase superfamily protein
MIVENLRRFSRLSGEDKKVVAGAICGAIATRIGLRVLGCRPWKEFLRPSLEQHEHTKTPFPSMLKLDRARRIAHLQLASEHCLFFRPTCLEHSVVLQRLLAKEGIEGRFRLGARKDNGDFKAHAWIEVGETIVDNFNDSEAFVRFGSPDPVTEE